ncbi:MAG: NAD-dependent epimerase/dehydratase family protein [Bryobacteraceae bacterium]
MRVVVVGGTGHVGTWLAPMLVEAGHEVVCMSRGQRSPYQPNSAWANIRSVHIDRKVEESAGRFGRMVRDLGPDAVVDMTCFTLESAQQIASALAGSDTLLAYCGTIWVHGHSTVVPATEDLHRRPFGDYGCRKAAIESYLLDESRAGRLKATVFHPGHIVGPGWAPLNPAGHFDPEVFARLGRGETVALPNLGLETVHHVHAADVAQAFAKAVGNPGAAAGESFHVVSPAAVTLRGYAEAVAAWFGREARLEFLPWLEWQRTVSPEQAASTWDHIAHSPNCSIEKARKRLGYEPRYTSLAAVQESLQWLMDSGALRV